MQKLLFDEPPLVVCPTLAKIVGLNGAIILQQMHYWLQRSTNIQDGHRWVYNSYRQWSEQFPFWSEATIKRAIRKLEDDGFIISANYNKLAFDKTKWYRIDYERLNNESPTMGSKCTDDEGDLTQPIPETTPETTPSEREKAPIDPLADILSRQGDNGEEGIADPSKDHELWLQYNQEFPALYHKHTGEYLGSAAREEVAKLTQQPDADPSLWSEVVRRWVLRGWNPKNIDGMIDCYTRRELPGSGREHKQAEIVTDGDKKIKVVK